MLALCPVCKRCSFENGVCEDRVNRGRRFFLVGALALPVARKIESVATRPRTGTGTIYIDQSAFLRATSNEVSLAIKNNLVALGYTWTVFEFAVAT